MALVLMSGCADLPLAPAGPAAPRPALAALALGSTFTVQSLGLTGDETSYYEPVEITASGKVLLRLHQGGVPTLVIWEDGVLRAAIPPIPLGEYATTQCLADDGTVAYTTSGRRTYVVLPDGSILKMAFPTWLGAAESVQGCEAAGTILFRSATAWAVLRMDDDYYPVVPVSEAGPDEQLVDVRLNEVGELLQTFSNTVTGAMSVYVTNGTAVTNVPVVWPAGEQVLSFNAEGAMLLTRAVAAGGAVYPLPPPDGYTASEVKARDLNGLTQVVGQAWRHNAATGRAEIDVVVWTHVPPTPSAQIEAVSESVAQLAADGAVTEGTATSLTMKLNAADRMLASGNTSAAAGQLDGFLRQMTALMSAGRIDPAIGQSLLEAVGRLRNALG